RAGVDDESALPLDGGGVDKTAVEAAQDGHELAIRAFAALFDAGDGAHARVATGAPWQEQYRAVAPLGGSDRGPRLVGLEGDRDDHVGKDDASVQRQKWELDRSFEFTHQTLLNYPRLAS